MISRHIDVLVADDDHAEAISVSHILEEAGYETAPIPLSELGGALAQSSIPVVVASLPSGHATLALVEEFRLRSTSRAKSFIAICDAAMKQSVLRMGANAVVERPWSPSLLVETVHRHACVSPRHRVAFPLTIVYGPSEARQTGEALNMSETGLLVRCPSDLEIGQELTVEGEVPRGAFTMISQVVRQAAERGPEFWGLRLRHSSALVRGAIETYQLA